MMRSVMKFVVEKTSKEGARLGKLNELRRDPSMVVESPMCMIYTVVGSAPNLPRDLLDKIADLPRIAHFTLATLAEHTEALSEYKKGINHFAALQGLGGYSSIQDPAVATQAGYNDKSSVSVWGRSGRIKIDVDLFCKLQEALQVDFFQSLSDGDTDKSSSRKRLRKAVDRTLSFLDDCLEQREKSKVLQQIGIFGVLEGGFDENERIRSVKETLKRPIDGFCIEGFHNHGPVNENFYIPEVASILKTILPMLPADKPRLMHGIWRPDLVLQAVALGMDIFDSSYPHIVTERKSALTFDFTLKVDNLETRNDSPTCRNTNNVEVKEPNTKRPFEICLKDPENFDSFEPLVEGCMCYTCQTHSRSYIHHLINTAELLAPTLLIIHNFHHYFRFFEAIRDSIRNDTFSQLCHKIQEQSDV